MTNGRLIVVSNRLPVSVVQQGEGVRLQPSPGGLATALSSLWNPSHHGLWIGSVGRETDDTIDRLLAEFSAEQTYDLHAISLTAKELEKFYAGFANEIIWPLFHDFQSRCNFDPDYWEMYQKVNRTFAAKVSELSAADDLIWVHDYHFMLLARYLRETHSRCRLGFFQHIPFPTPDVFDKLPWRETVLQALLDFDVLGFQTERDRTNFINCVLRLCPKADVDVTASQTEITLQGRHIVVGAFPISIDFEEFNSQAAEPEVASRAAAIRQELQDSILVLGVDRMDYTKGIPERLQAFRILLEQHPELCRRIVLVQIVVPSRSDIPEYQGLREQVELLVSQINGKFTQPGWVPVQYLYRSVPRHELLAYYRAADVALITPLIDGMNLVAKEFCAAQVDQRGVLILSEFAGATQELGHGALLVNPNDFVGVANAIFRATQMRPEKKRSQLALLREIVKNFTVSRWARSFLDTLAGRPCRNGHDRNRSSMTGAAQETPGVALIASTRPRPVEKEKYGAGDRGPTGDHDRIEIKNGAGDR
ncbi:MAG TPA: trehalose-6-phosphate synthase, partial [Terriglobales bacterium]